MTDFDELSVTERNILIATFSKSDEILDNAFNKLPIERHFQPRILPYLRHDLKEFYLKKIHCDIQHVKQINRETLGQKNNAWKLERRKRVRASDAYKLYTYTRNKKPDWPKKITEYVNPKTFKSAAMEYGSDTEKNAFLSYKQKYNVEMCQLGFVVSPMISWLGCSVDGFIPQSNKTVEFKCPVLGATKDIFEVLPTLKYLDENRQLKVNHMYFCQVQLGMAILNAEACDFVVYCKRYNQLHVITIPFNKIEVDKYIISLSNVFFDHLLPKVLGT